MLPKQHRIQARKDFLLCYNQGEKNKTRTYIVFVNKTLHPVWRLGVTVTRKSGNAVLRNRFKRIVRAFFIKYGTFVCNGYDFVVLSKYPLDASFLCLQRVEKELLPMFMNANFIVRSAGDY